MKKTDIKWYHHGYRLFILALAGVLVFCGVMSLVGGDVVVRYATAAFTTLIVVKELY